MFDSTCTYTQINVHLAHIKIRKSILKTKYENICTDKYTLETYQHVWRSAKLFNIVKTYRKSEKLTTVRLNY